MKRILVGVDGSEPADRAIDAAARLAAETGAELTLLAVLSLPRVLDSEAEAFAKSEHASKQEFQDLFVDPRPPFLKRARDRVATGVQGIEAVATIGDPAEEIVNAAKRRHADVIVVGRRGRGHVAGLVFGSVSLKILQLATCPVLVVP